MKKRKKRHGRPKFYRVMKNGAYHGIFQNKDQAIRLAKEIGATSVEEAVGGKAFKPI
jgi:hypothetical protein